MAKQFLSAISCYPGLVGAPGLYLGSDTTTGIYRIGANNLGVTVSGSKVLDIASTGLNVTGKLKVGSMREAVIQTGNYGTVLTNGLKIKTNLPGGSGFWNDNTTTLWIEGYDYRTASVFNVAISWYGYSGGNTFFNQTITSYGGIAPTATLSIESGKVVINFAINTGGMTDHYYGYLTIRAYDLVNSDSAYAGWSVVDEAVTGTQSVTLTYKNRFQNVTADGNLYVSGGATVTRGSLGDSIVFNATGGSSGYLYSGSGVAALLFGANGSGAGFALYSTSSVMLSPDQSKTLTISNTGGSVVGPLDVNQGSTNAIRLGYWSDATTYGAISYNGVYTYAGFLGIGGSAASGALYYNVAGGSVTSHVFRVAGVDRLTINNTSTILTSNLNISGTTKTAGYFDAGAVAPTNTNRLNYDGYLYATRFYGDGSQLTGVTATPSADIYAFAAAYG